MAATWPKRSATCAPRRPTSHLAKQAERARQILKSVPVFDQAGLSALQQSIARSNRAVQQDFELAPFITSLLEDVRAIGFEHVIFGLMNENLTCIRGRLAAGESVLPLRRCP